MEYASRKVTLVRCPLGLLCQICNVSLLVRPSALADELGLIAHPGGSHCGLHVQVCNADNTLNNEVTVPARLPTHTIATMSPNQVHTFGHFACPYVEQQRQLALSG
eukprot:4064717-Lingulodinium_polyedra.AAC.1